MKKAIYPKLLAGVLILLYLGLKAQSATQKETIPSFSISNWDWKFLYIGIDNTLEIEVPGVANKDIQVTIDTPGTITYDMLYPKFYKAYFPKSGQCTIYVSAKINGRITKIGNQKYRMKDVVAVPMTTGNMEGGGVRAEVMKTQQGLKSMIKNMDIDAGFSILSYSMVFISEGKIYKAQTTGSAFSAEMKKYLNEAKTGDAVFFEGIKGMGPANRPHELGSMAFYIL
jgi:hypothetical protein